MPDITRRVDLAKIHIARKQLGLDEDTYRMMLRNVTGKESAGDLSRRQRITLLNHLRAKGFRERPAQAERATAAGSDAQHRLIHVLWIKLHQAGKVHDPSDPALNAFVKRMTGIDHVEGLYSRKANIVIEALKAWLARAGK